jgi:hypothetical protein
VLKRIKEFLVCEVVVGKISRMQNVSLQELLRKCWTMIIQIGDKFVEHEIPPKKLKLTCRKVGRILAVENPPEMLEHDHSKRETTC